MIKGDTFKHMGLRQKLMSELQEKGIKDERVLESMMAIPRHVFMDSALDRFSYSDQAFPIGYEQTISQPYTVAFQTELLQVQKGHKILEIGTGSGYQAWVLANIGAEVHSLERIKGLHNRSKAVFSAYQVPVKAYHSDGFKGLPEEAPFDGIIVTCGAPEIPQDLLLQLKIGGRMVIPLGEGEKQVMVLIVRVSESEFKRKNYGNFSFVPMRKSIE